MHINFGPRGILQIDDATIVFRNFAGEGTKFNRAGDRNFAIVIEDQETADALIDEGWNVKVRPPREEGDTPFMFLPVKVKFRVEEVETEDGVDYKVTPPVYLKSGEAEPVKLDEESIECLDQIDIERIDIDVRPYNWEVNGKTGRTAYLYAMHVEQDLWERDRFASRYR